MDQRIGIDIGGTKTEIALFCLESQSTELQIQTRQRIPTDLRDGYDSFIATLAKDISRVCKSFGVNLKDVSLIGLGAPGSLNPETQTLTRSSVPALSGRKIGDDLVRMLAQPELPHRLENDANCFLRAEMLFGSGRDFAPKMKEGLAIGVTVGTGLGGGIWVRGGIFGGRRGFAGEFGHTVVKHMGRACFCGRFGCAERYVSGVGIEESYKERVGQERALRTSEIFALAEEGDPTALSVIAETKETFAHLLSNLINTLDPDVIILGGGVSNQRLFLTDLPALLSQRMFYGFSAPPLVTHRLGDSAGSIGAALVDSNT